MRRTLAVTARLVYTFPEQEGHAFIVVPGRAHRKQNFLSRLREQFENVRFGWLQFQHKRVFEVDGEDEVSDCARNRGFLATCAGVRALFAIRELRL